VANATTVSFGCYCCNANACCINEYAIISGGNTVGLLTCAGGTRGERHKLTFDAEIIDGPSRALLLAVFIIIVSSNAKQESPCTCTLFKPHNLYFDFFTVRPILLTMLLWTCWKERVSMYLLLGLLPTDDPSRVVPSICTNKRAVLVRFLK